MKLNVTPPRAAWPLCSDVLNTGWTTFEGYTSPLGLGFVVEGGAGGGGCAPKPHPEPNNIFKNVPASASGAAYHLDGSASVELEGSGPGPHGMQCPMPSIEPHTD